MINVKGLRYVCHVLVGGNYSTFSVPKHQAQVTQIGDGHILCKASPEQADPDKYEASEIEGIAIDNIIPILEKKRILIKQIRRKQIFPRRSSYT